MSSRDNLARDAMVAMIRSGEYREMRKRLDDRGADPTQADGDLAIAAFAIARAMLRERDRLDGLLSSAYSDDEIPGAGLVEIQRIRARDGAG